MKNINLSEAKSKLGRLLKEVQAGETYLICERNQPLAVLSGYPENNPGVVRPGLLKNRFSVPTGFDEPLEEFEKDFYAGQIAQSSS